jgi:hypothetical protein
MYRFLFDMLLKSSLSSCGLCDFVDDAIEELEEARALRRGGLGIGRPSMSL